jgi:hypothetical protein
MEDMDEREITAAGMCAITGEDDASPKRGRGSTLLSPHFFKVLSACSENILKKCQ